MYDLQVESEDGVNGGVYRYTSHRGLRLDTDAIGLILKRSLEKRWASVVRTVTATDSITGRTLVVWDNQKKDWVHG